MKSKDKDNNVINVDFRPRERCVKATMALSRIDVQTILLALLDAEETALHIIENTYSAAGTEEFEELSSDAQAVVRSMTEVVNQHESVLEIFRTLAEVLSGDFVEDDQ